MYGQKANFLPARFLRCLVVVIFLIIGSSCQESRQVSQALEEPSPTMVSQRTTPSPALAGTATARPSATPTQVEIRTATPTPLPTTVTPAPVSAPVASLPPFQPLRDTRIVDRSLRRVHAITDGTQKYRTAVWSPSSAWIAAVPQDGAGIDLIHSRTGEVVNVVTDTHVLEPVWDATRSEGCLLVHQVDDADTLRRFCAANRDFDPRPIAQSALPIRAPSITGPTIAYSTDQALIVTLEGGGQQPLLSVPGGALTTALSVSSPTLIAWTPLVTNLVEVQIMAMEIAMPSSARPLSSPGEGWWLAAWSRDGTRLVANNIGGRIGIISADGTARTDLGPGEAASWSPDGKRVAYAGSSAGLEYTTRDIHIVDTEGQGPRLRLTDANEEQFYVSPSWSPDGTQLAFVEIDSGQVFIGDVP